MERDPGIDKPGGGTLRCEIFPADLDKTVDFYTDVLRFDVERDERGAVSPYVALRRGNVRLGAAARPAPPSILERRPPTGVELVLEVDDVVAEHEHVRARWSLDAPLTLAPWGLWDFRLLDPSGYYWRITSS